MASSTAVGVDFGTTNSCIALFKQKRVQTVQGQSGNPLTKSAIYFSIPRAFGEAALSKQGYDSSNVIYGVKRMIGRSFCEVAEFAKSVLFRVENNDNRPEIHVTWDCEPKKFRPEQAAAAIIQQLLEKANELAGEEVTKAVIAVPAAYNEDQRRATKLLGSIAGLHVLAIINEPTAAALAWADENREVALSDKEHHLLVFDMGGGTTDVTVVQCQKGKLCVIYTNGDASVGGDNIDELLQKHFLDEIREKYQQDLSTNKRYMEKLRRECTTIKHLLSEDECAHIPEMLFGTLQVSLKLRQSTFNKITKPIQIVAKKLVQQAFDAIENPADVKTLLIGGATRMRWCAKMCESVLNKGNVVLQSVNKESAVAHGAALWAAKLSNFGACPEIELNDVACSSYGIEVSGGKMKHLITRNTAVPCVCSKTFYPNEEGQQAVTIRIFQGDSEHTSEKQRLKEFRVKLQPNQGSVDVKFELSKESLLTVTVGDAVEVLPVDALHVRTEPEVEEMRRISRQLCLADIEEIRKRELRHDLEYMDDTAWLEGHPNASLEQLEARVKKLKN